MKNKFLYNQLSTILSSQKFKLIFMLIFLNSIYVTITMSNVKIDNCLSLLMMSVHPYYNIILLVIIMMGTFYTITSFNDSQEYIIRLETKKQKNKQMAILCIYETMIIYFIQFMVTIIIKNLFFNNGFNIFQNINGVNIIIYILYFVIRNSILMGIIVYGLVILSEYINKYILAIFLIILFLLQPQGLYIPIFIDILSIPLLVSDYFYNIFGIPFINDFIGSLLYIIILYMFILGLLYLIKKRKNKKFSLNIITIKPKTLFSRTIFFTIFEKFKYLLIYTVLLIGGLLFRKSSIQYSPNLFMDILGLKFNLEQDIIFILFFVFYIIYFIYLSISLFINDLQYEKQNLFLRISYKKWLNKTLFAMIIGTFLIRLLNYVIVMLVYFKLGGTVNMLELLKIFMIDYIYIVLLQLCSIMIYSNYLLKRKINIVNIICGILLIFINLLPKIFAITLICIYMCLLFLQLFMLKRNSYTKVLEGNEEL